MIIQGDARNLPLPDCSVDTVVTDPPYELNFMGKRWDASGVAFDPATWAEVLRVAKPGAMLLAFGGTRTWHRLACAIEDAGWLIRDTIMWVQGQGFPKSHDISKALDKAAVVDCPNCNGTGIGQRLDGTYVALCTNHTEGGLWGPADFETERCVECGEKIVEFKPQTFPCPCVDCKGTGKVKGAEREVVGPKTYAGGLYTGKQLDPGGPTEHEGYQRPCKNDPDWIALHRHSATAPATPLAQLWDGWGTALAPSFEPVIVAQKPVDTGRGPDIILGNLCQLEAKLWSLLPANVAIESFGLSPKEYAEACAFARWSAGERSNTLDALSTLADTSLSASVISTGLNTVSSWRSTLVAHFRGTSLSTTSTETSPTIDLKTLKSCSSAITPRCIIAAAMRAPGQLSSVSYAVRYLSAAVMKLNATQELSVLGSAIEKEPTSLREGLELDPNWRPIILAMKPLDGTFARNAERHGVAGLWIDGGRIGTGGGTAKGSFPNEDSKGVYGNGLNGACEIVDIGKGRWPANLLLSPEAAEELDRQTRGERSSKPRGGQTVHKTPTAGKNVCYGQDDREFWTDGKRFNDSGGASRFFYVAKPSRAERDAGLGGKRCTHPTQKPLALMRYLVRLTRTPTGGTVLDPFCGSGTTGMACVCEERDFIGVDLNPDYCELARARIAHVEAHGPRWDVDQRQTSIMGQGGLFDP